MNVTIGESFHRAIIFSGLQLSGSYKFKDIFQLFPGKNDWPGIDDNALSKKPIVLEYDSSNHLKYLLDTNKLGAENSLEEKFRHLDFRKELLAILTLLSNFYYYTENYSINRSELGSDYFENGFSKINGESLNFKTHDEMLNHEYFLGDQLSFPSNTDQILSCYFDMSYEIFIRFRMSISLFYNSFGIRKHSPSMSFVSMVSAIENLIDIEREITNLKFKRCEKCNQHSYRLTRRFVDFIIKNIGNDTKAFKKYVEKIYSIRSNVAHLGELFYNDVAETELDIKTSCLLKNTQKIVRQAMVNWLINCEYITTKKHA